MFSRVLVILPCILVAACSSQSPLRTDPLVDLVGNARIADSPTRVIDGARSRSLALIVSTSTESQIKYQEESHRNHLEGYVKRYEPASYGPVKKLYDSVEPRRLIESVITELRTRFKTVTVVGDLAEFRDRNLDLAAVIDLGMEGKSDSSMAAAVGEYTTDVSLFLFDKQIRRIGVAKGKATENIEVSLVGSTLKAALLVFPDQKPEEQLEPFVKAELKSRESAVRLLRESLDALVQR